jgi:hypothetical protein
MTRRRTFGKLLLFILLVAAGLRILGLDMALYGDETLFAENVRTQDYVHYYTAHPPLSSWILNASGALFGDSVIAMRATVALFSILSILFTALLVRKKWGDRTALVTAGLLGISPWFLAGSLQLDIVGSFLTLFYVLTFFFYHRFLDRRAPRDLALTGVSIGLGMLTNYSAALLGPILALHYLLTQRKEKQFTYRVWAKNLAIIGVISAIVFAIFPLWSLATGSPRFADSVGHPLDLIAAKPGEGLRPAEGLNFGLLAIQYLNAFVWMGPLFLFGLIFFLKRENKDELSWLFIIQIILAFLFFTFVIQDNFRPVEKYLLILAPAFAALTARACARFTVGKKWMLSVLGAALALFYGLNFLSSSYLPFYPKFAYVSAALHGNWAVKLPLLGHAGPIGLYVTIGTIAIAFIACAAFACISLMATKRSPQESRAFAVFCLIGLAFSAYLSLEVVAPIASPDISAVTHDLNAYMLKTQPPEPVLYFRNNAFDYYFEGLYGMGRNDHGMPLFTRQLDFGAENNPKQVARLDNATVIVVNFPRINENSMLWQRLGVCETLYESAASNERIGWVARC